MKEACVYTGTHLFNFVHLLTDVLWLWCVRAMWSAYGSLVLQPASSVVAVFFLNKDLAPVTVAGWSGWPPPFRPSVLVSRLRCTVRAVSFAPQCVSSDGIGKTRLQIIVTATPVATLIRVRVMCSCPFVSGNSCRRRVFSLSVRWKVSWAMSVLVAEWTGPQ